MNDDYDAIVIGAGNAGLSSAATLQRGGRRTLLVERHNVPGGAATSFVRGRFEFEVSLHQLGGMGNGPLRQVLDQLDVTRRLTFVEERDLYRTVVPGVLDITLPAEWKGVADAIEDSFPGNRARVESFLELCHEVGNWQLVARASLHQPQEQAAWLRGLSRVRRNGLRPAKEVLDEYFDDDRIKHVLASYWSYNGQPPSTLPFMDLARILTLYLEYKPYHLRGGSQAMSSAMLDSFLEAGGDVRFNSDVAEIRTRQGTVVGVRLANGDEYDARMVVSNASAITTYTRMLDPTVVPDSVLRDLRGRKLGISGTIIYLGLDATAHELGFTAGTNMITSELAEKTVRDSMFSLGPTPYVVASCYDVDPIGFAPPRASHVAIFSVQYGRVWDTLAPEDYARAKYAYAQSQLDLVEVISPGLRDVIEEAEVATPHTLRRYLGHPGGAIYGFDQDITDSWLFRDTDLKPNVPGLFLLSAWTTAGGYNPTIVTAARFSQRLLQL
ncbi:NAD(P)/FAD-dependent oxidoreductase [Salinispora arenicola]|uniref:phytoene desaturase family protein n=1 Tax=Salinispora arenicola TaxID=168697 RepID=UPI000367BCE6|nr:NAD(P)/FAD-dependent oxidoreductase [Salinispora arenicola]NIL42575.1 NAD(P)/FAD-dependent oxidoreductase [Salinispora arenicola]NIL56344.1 NAD(P)/FAD-dependent oxidoreductase [Salinispora arenicola]NIL62459.1 NAD(P)/FAD-dependent oxidoreductase [Salinispora arenicola]